MQINMNKQIKTLAQALLLGATFAASVAYAGSKFTGNGHVVVTRNADGTGSVIGYLGMIYNYTGNDEWIGCQKNAQSVVFCHARAIGDMPVSCTSTSAFLASSVASISPDARLLFRWDASGRCTNITVTHSSEFEDKK
jgi:hypothetical protein